LGGARVPGLQGGEWVVVGEDAERLRRMASRVRSTQAAAILRIAADTLEDLAYRLMLGQAPGTMARTLESLESLLRLYRLPTAPVKRARKILLSRVRENYGALVGGDDLVGLGLPA